MKLRLYHHEDGARVAYREAGTGPGLVLLHSALFTHREFEPAVEHLTHRFRVILPDLPLHGDSEDRSRHPYSPDWFADVVSAFCAEVCGPRALVAGHGLGAEIALHAVATGRMTPERLVLMPNRLHAAPGDARRRAAWRLVTRAGGMPVIDRVSTHAAKQIFTPEYARKLSVRGDAAAGDLARHALADVGGNVNLARSWAKYAKRWPTRPARELLEAYPRMDLPVLLLWADEDERHPLAVAEQALDLLPQGQLRVLSRTGYLIAYDDPVGVARELVAFCG